MSFSLVNMFANLLFVFYLPFNFLSNYLVQWRGLRFTLCLALGLASIGAWLRALFNQSVATAFLGQSLLSMFAPLYNNMVP